MDADLAALPLASAADYVAAIGQHVASVCVITTLADGAPWGLTATAVASVSADPARLLVCVNKTSNTHPRILASGRFCVNVLSEAQDRLAMLFAGMAGAQADRFAAAEWTTLKTGAPALVGAAASLDCRLASISDQSTHTVMFGDVVATRHQPGQDALVYGVRRFRQLRKVFSGLAESDADYL